MLNSTTYIRQCKTCLYITKLNTILEKLSKLNDINHLKHWVESKKPLLCSYGEIDQNNLINTNLKMVNDYLTKKNFYGYTMFDICIRKNIKYFKSIFKTLGTKEFLQYLYQYMDKLPRQLNEILSEILSENLNFHLNDTLNDKKINKDEFLSNSLLYFKCYINTFLCYDLLTVFLENYKNSNDLEQMIWLEIVMDDIINLIINYTKCLD